MEASTLQPQDPVYLANVSAVQYELGKYEECCATLLKALALFTDSDPNYSLQSRLLLRQAKCLFYLNKFSEGKEIAQKLKTFCATAGIPSPDTDDVQTHALNQGEVPEAEWNEMSMFKPPLRMKHGEYFCVSHDNPQSAFVGMWDKEKGLPLKEESYSILFAGIADARHLFASLADLGNASALSPFPKTIHFTLVDVKAVVIARDLILLYVLNDLSAINPKEHLTKEEAIQLLALLQYLYLGVIMPRYLYDKLQLVIKKLISDIQNKNLPNWITLNPSSSSDVLEYLQDWTSPQTTVEESLKITVEPAMPGEFVDTGENYALDVLQGMSDLEIMSLPHLPKHANATQRRAMLRQLVEDPKYRDSKAPKFFLPDTFLEACLYHKIRILCPPQQLKEKHPELKSIIDFIGQEYDTNKVAHFQTLIQKIDLKFIYNNWKPNPTVWDKNWIKTLGKQYFNFDWNPSEEMEKIFRGEIVEKKRKFTFDYCARFFSRVSSALSTLSKVIKLEWILGDVYNLCEKLVDNTAREYSVLYDRIYLSNIPDYTGGHLTTSFFAPLLKQLPHAYVANNVLLNTTAFRNVDHWTKTYTLLPNVDVHPKYLGLRYISGTIIDYMLWNVVTRPLPSSMWLKQAELMEWLYAVFLLIVLPPQTEPMESLPRGSRVEHPLNLLGFIRLLKRLEILGYPRHWLGGVLDALLSGQIKTTSCPPPKSFSNKQQTISTKPFCLELETAISISRNKFPFRTLAPIPSPLCEIKLKLVSTIPFMMQYPVFALLFGSKKDIQHTVTGLRHAIILQDLAVHLVSLLLWDPEKTVATVLLPLERLEKMKKDNWFVVPVRLDSWTHIGPPFALRECILQ
eukprot:Phypoly_transcript_02114.p1 GENE.Phypoly_transcript_02114~~Phypoly_transcript_02114.p1  ORF type:complete len:881 (+),score=99.61 Phypoly_transcript_02114:86-2644(+)